MLLHSRTSPPRRRCDAVAVEQALFCFSSASACPVPFYHSSDPPDVQFSASNALEHSTSIAAPHYASAIAPSQDDVNTQQGEKVQDNHFQSLSTIALAEHPHVAADASLGKDDAVSYFRPGLSCKVNDCALFQRGRISYSFLPVANQEADAEDRRCCDLPRPADDESRALDGAATRFYTELAVFFLRIAFLRTIVSSVSIMHLLCAVNRFRSHFATKWPKHKRLRVSRIVAGAMFALCIVTSPVSTKSQVYRLH
jgi:hypothetical protein